jgi:phage baseplate assembly protein W
VSDFLGAGWDFLGLARPWDGDAHGAPSLVAHEESIRQAVWVVLGTAPGERVMRPGFGCGIHDLVFSVQNEATRARVADAVREALVRWEPRIEVLDVTAEPDAKTPAQLLIEVEYRVRTTNNQFNLVYPFYLDGSTA